MDVIGEINSFRKEGKYDSAISLAERCYAENPNL
jgi:hypothetical protein